MGGDSGTKGCMKFEKHRLKSLRLFLLLPPVVGIVL